MTPRIPALLASLFLSLLSAHALDGGFEIGGTRIAAPADWVPVPPEPASAARIAQWSLPQGGEAVAFYFGEGKGGDVQANLSALAKMMTTATGGPAPVLNEEKARAGASAPTWRVSSFASYGIYLGDPLRSGIPALPKPDWGLIGIAVEFPGGPLYLRITGPAATVRALVSRFGKKDGSLLPLSASAPVEAAPQKSAVPSGGSKARK
ncbi:hypothetical protein SAMN05444156_1646 [Verrucomicrobium sp. GAS474]|uniref:hypothetical protein n=1 Tax=Verrucomicrobium sp. GAS474 TaxID=1882831 RepID=UPI00087DCDE0|nr:hypothetical protein [Verrucomicrobium sp. GAS474]SDU04638.1 hypothetical protein SAMN05444156_1646 [Verrucomicrobium sp. GAS474]